MAVYISLLRGINVGGNKRIKMADLKVLYEVLGFSGAQTLLQSGNVVFESATAEPEQIAAQIEAGIVQRYGFESKIIIRTCDQLRAVVENHPFSADQLAEPSKILLTFLQREPESAAVQNLIEAHTGSEMIYSNGRELYLYYPDGMGRSKLDNGLIERRLKVVGTGRNWNTVNKLLALAEGM
jgi:uncharacterized protein (DUF1697 family)